MVDTGTDSSGHGGKVVVPTFSLGEDGAWLVSITPPIFGYPPYRHMRPDTLRVPSHQEVLHDSYTMGYLDRRALLKRERLTIGANVEFKGQGPRETRLWVRAEPVPFPAIPAGDARK
jgi:hypothetical protein